jgi:hypothetical protein
MPLRRLIGDNESIDFRRRIRYNFTAWAWISSDEKQRTEWHTLPGMNNPKIQLPAKLAPSCGLSKRTSMGRFFCRGFQAE